MTLEEVAALTRVPANTLRFWRVQRTEGPASFRVGRRVVYRRAVVEAWLHEQEAAGQEARAVSSGR